MNRTRTLFIAAAGLFILSYVTHVLEAHAQSELSAEAFLAGHDFMKGDTAELQCFQNGQLILTEALSDLRFIENAQGVSQIYGYNKDGVQIKVLGVGGASGVICRLAQRKSGQQ